MLRRAWGRVRGTAVLVVVVVLGLTVYVAGFDFGGGDATPTPTTNGHIDPFIPYEITWGTGRTMAPGGVFADVAANDLMSCGIRVDGELVCWGQVDTPLPQGVFARVFLSSGRSGDEGSGCVLGVHGAIQCWVSPGGVWVAPEGAFVDVSAGSGHWCAIRKDGGVVCWGQGFDGHEVLAASGFVRVTSGGGWPAYPVCALDASGSVTCWGDELGTGLVEPPGGLFESVTAASYRPGAGPSVRLGEVLAGSAVAEHGDGRAVVGDVCGIRQGGSLECWNQPGLRPLVMSADEFQDVSLGARHGCVVAIDASVRCWGDNEAGQRGPQLRRVFEWIVGDAVCQRDGLLPPVRCVRWADGEPIPRDDSGHPYAGVPDDQVDPRRGPFTQMAAGRLHACGLRPDGAVACWALLDDSLLNAVPRTLDGAQQRLRDCHDEHWRDQDIAPEGRFTQIAAGETHTCALDENGRIVCWGQPDRHPEPPQGRYTQLSAASWRPPLVHSGGSARSQPSTPEETKSAAYLKPTSQWPAGTPGSEPRPSAPTSSTRKPFSRAGSPLDRALSGPTTSSNATAVSTKEPIRPKATTPKSPSAPSTAAPSAPTAPSLAGAATNPWSTTSERAETQDKFMSDVSPMRLDMPEGIEALPQSQPVATISEVQIAASGRPRVCSAVTCGNAVSHTSHEGGMCAKCSAGFLRAFGSWSVWHSRPPRHSPAASAPMPY